jgi:hypothetical protein
VIEPERIVVATVFENRHPYSSEAEILFRTLNAYGGGLAQARKFACSVGDADPFVAEVLSDLGVEVITVKTFDERCPHANKIAMLELASEGDYLLALDTDIAVAADPTPWLDSECVVAKPVDQDPIGLASWPELFAARGVTIPPSRHLTHFTALPTIPYFNSGVIGLPTRYCAPLLEEWSEGVRWLLDSYDQLPATFAKNRFFTDQFAFALALARLELPVRALPLELNFPTHTRVHPLFEPDRCRPVLIHHHHRFEPSGVLLPGSHQRPNSEIARINDELSRDPEAPLEGDATTSPARRDATPDRTPRPGQAQFDNQKFWNERYSTNMALGSGIGSRGDVAEQKRALLQTVIDEHRVTSILDVGCGDTEIVRKLTFDGSYIGIDIAEVVISRNSDLAPDWEFLHGDFVTIVRDQPLAADMVVCMDVLIHQHDSDYYAAFVQELVGATRLVGVIAAYDEVPPAHYASQITAYHGPITDMLRLYGATDVRVVDEYRGTAVVLFGPPERG